MGGTWASLISFNRLIISLRRHYSRQPTVAGVRAQVAARTTLSTASVAALKFPFPNSWKRRHNIFCIFPIIYKGHILNESIAYKKIQIILNETGKGIPVLPKGTKHGADYIQRFLIEKKYLVGSIWTVVVITGSSQSCIYRGEEPHFPNPRKIQN